MLDSGLVTGRVLYVKDDRHQGPFWASGSRRSFWASDSIGSVEFHARLTSIVGSFGFGRQFGDYELFTNLHA